MLILDKIAMVLVLWVVILLFIIEEFDLDIDIQSVLDYFYYYKDIDNEGNIFLNNEKENVINNSNINDFKLLNWVVYKRFLWMVI